MLKDSQDVGALEDDDTKQRAEHRNIERSPEDSQTHTSTHEELRHLRALKDADGDKN